MLKKKEFKELKEENKKLKDALYKLNLLLIEELKRNDKYG